MVCTAHPHAGCDRYYVTSLSIPRHQTPVIRASGISCDQSPDDMETSDPDDLCCDLYSTLHGHHLWTAWHALALCRLYLTVLMIPCHTLQFREPALGGWITGIDKAGKTTLLERLKTSYASVPGTDRDKILPTVGLNVGRMQVELSDQSNCVLIKIMIRGFDIKCKVALTLKAICMRNRFRFQVTQDFPTLEWVMLDVQAHQAPS